MKQQQQSGRLWGLDLLKFLCAIVILNWHIWQPEAMQFLFTEKIVCTFLVCSGYVWCLSLDRRQAGLKGYYQKVMWRHLGQILLPYTALFLAEVFYHSFWITWTKDAWLWLDPYTRGDAQGYFRVSEMLARFWQGGLGPGGYYMGFLIQLVVLFGILHQVAKKAPKAFGLTVLALVGIGCVWRLPIWNGYQWIVSNALHIRPLEQQHILIVLLGIALYHNRSRLPVWGFLPVLVVAAAVNQIAPDAADLFWAWGAFWCALECSRLSVPAGAAALVGHLGRASYFIYLMQKAYCATALPRWLALKWNLYGGWNVLFCLLLGVAFYGVYTALGRLAGTLWKYARIRQTDHQKGNSRVKAAAW